MRGWIVAVALRDAPRRQPKGRSRKNRRASGSRISATVEQVYVRESDTVARGGLLVRLAAADLRW